MATIKSTDRICRFIEIDAHGSSDALYFFKDEFEAMSDADVTAKEQERIAVHVARKNAPVVVPTTAEQLAAMTSDAKNLEEKLTVIYEQVPALKTAGLVFLKKDATGTPK